MTRDPSKSSNREWERNMEAMEEKPVSAVEWSAAAVRLLQGVVYHDDGERLWDLILRHAAALRSYFAKIGLEVILDEADGMAYLHPANNDADAEDGQDVPRLFRRIPLSYDVTLLCVLLRDELRRYEESDVTNERCVVAQSDLYALWQAFFPATEDALKLQRQLASSLRKLEELRFVRAFEKDPPTWEIRRILKARLPLNVLDQLRLRLLNELESKGGSQTLLANEPRSQREEF